MTNEQHNKILGIMHLAYGALNGLVMLLIGIFFIVLVPVLREGPGRGDGMPLIIFFFFISMITLLGLFYSVPSLVAGYALLKRKSWARLAAIIGSVFAGMNVPLGTALCVYSLWFLFGQGARMYDQASLPSQEPYSLRDASTASADFFDRDSSGRGEREPTATRQMPNWRD
jgi:hypothetical protein